MPRVRMKVCACIGCPAHERSCPELTTATRCGADGNNCAGQYEKARGTRQQRGYGPEHERLRARWELKILRCDVKCARCRRLILPGMKWHLDHSDDRSTYLGPSHERCNTSAGGRAAHA